MNDQLKLFAEHLDEKIKLKGIWEMLDGVVLEKGIEQGYEALQRFSPELAKELLDLIEAYMQADQLNMIDEAADLFVSIVKLVFFSKSIRLKQ